MRMGRTLLFALAATAVILLPSFSAGAQFAGAAPAAVKDAAAKAAAEGVINLFDTETLFGWTPYGDAQWKVVSGVMSCEAGSGGWISTTTQWADFEMSAKIRVAADGSTGLVFRAAADGHPSENGSYTILLSEPEKSSPDWRDIHVIADGAKVTATVDGKEVKIAGGGRAKGYIGIQYHRNGNVELAEMSLKPLNMKPIFNGKDFTGWNIIPGHKSEFSVIDGALNIKNGNGQIETAGIYKDFVLQLDIFSNGDHLNSGVFFHGPVGKFWKGYECQVRNQWEDDDRTKPVDYGTGGIYGDQPARKVVSNDREWFKTTILCEGNHMAVWLNGYQVSDYLDTRPVSPDWNGKEGFVPGPGTIHLQGHDPTTDLSFKNIVLQEYPK